MNTRAWIYSFIIYVVLTFGLVYLFSQIWPENKTLTTIIPFVVSGLITHLIRKLYDFIFDLFNRKTNDTFLGVYLKVDHTSRRLTGYGASEGNIIQAGHFKGNYEVEAELIITIQNESPNTMYAIEVTYTPNQYLQRYALIDTRANKLQPLEGNRHFEFKLRIKNEYYDMYVQDVDKEFGNKVYMVGKGVSLLNGSQITIKYKDAKHKEHVKTQTIV